jgi:hypothetical protein
LVDAELLAGTGEVSGLRDLIEDPDPVPVQYRTSTILCSADLGTVRGGRARAATMTSLALLPHSA